MKLQAWAMHVLGLHAEEGLDVEQLKARARKRGRQLLAEHHPDRGGDEDRFKAINSVLQKLDQIPILTTPKPRTVVSYYPPVHPDGPSATVTTTIYGKSRVVRSSGIRYDARKVVPMKPR